MNKHSEQKARQQELEKIEKLILAIAKDLIIFIIIKYLVLHSHQVDIEFYKLFSGDSFWIICNSI